MVRILTSQQIFLPKCAETTTVAAMILSGFQDKCREPMDRHPLSAYYSASLLRAIRCWPQDRVRKLVSDSERRGYAPICQPGKLSV